MWKKRVCGLTLLVAGLLVWSCGDGSVDALGDKELLMISRFDPVDMRDSIVLVCYKNGECWKKFEKTGEIFLGDFYFKIPDTTLLRLVTGGDSLVVEGDSAFVWKDGKKLPVFNFSSNSNDDDDDDVTSSGSTATSGSSSKRSSASGFEKDEGSEFGDDPNSSGSGGKSRNHAEESSSSRNGSGNSSSIDASQYTNPSSSSRGTYTGSMSSHSRSSTSEIVISANTEVPSSSSVEPIYVSVASGTSGNSSSSKNGTSQSSASVKLCGDKAIEGTCVPDKNSVALNEQVTWTYTPDPGTCSDGNIEWQSLNEGNIKGNDSQILTADGTLKQSGGLSFVAAFSIAEKKEQTIFFMDGKRFNCLPVTVSQ